MLFPEHKSEILGGGWLTDGVISAVLCLLKKILIGGLQPTSIAEITRGGFDIQRGLVPSFRF